MEENKENTLLENRSSKTNANNSGIFPSLLFNFKVWRDHLRVSVTVGSYTYLNHPDLQHHSFIKLRRGSDYIDKGTLNSFQDRFYWSRHSFFCIKARYLFISSNSSWDSEHYLINFWIISFAIFKVIVLRLKVKCFQVLCFKSEWKMRKNAVELHVRIKS